MPGALERLVQGYTAAGDPDRALPYARRWVALDPLQEPARRRLMLLYAWTGRRAQALQQYRECVQVLDAELGVAPLDETTRLYEAIKENRPPPPPSALPERTPPLAPGAPATPPGPGAPLPLVGRAAEWATLAASYAGIGASGRVLVLAGEAGIGKTRLADELLAHVRAAGAATVAARCYEGEGSLPYALVGSLLRAALAQPAARARLEALPPPVLAEAGRLLPDLAAPQAGRPAPPPLDSLGAQTRFFEGLRQVLQAATAGPRPGILLCDDLQWIDPASLDLLTYLVRRLDAWPVALLLTWRPDDSAAVRRLTDLLSASRRTGPVTLLTLGRLDPAAVEALVRAATGPRPPGRPDLVARLYEETEGLPFFLVEYLAALSAGEGSPDWGLPGGVRDLLRSRLAHVDATAQQLLSTAAVIGRSFDFDTVRAASGRSEDEAVRALEALLANGLVVEMPDGGAGDLTYDFAHEKLRVLVYEETSLARRRLLHRRVAEALAERARHARDGGALAAQIAYHHQMAGNDAQAAEFYRQAGEHARRLYANAAALDHFRLALALGHPDAAALDEAIGDLQTLLGEYGAALASYETAAARGTPAALARLEHKLGTVYQRRGEWDRAESHLSAALAELEAAGAAPGEQARLYADWSLLTHQRAGRAAADVAEAQARRALALAEQAADTHALAQAYNILGILASAAGDPARAQAHLERSLALAEALGDPAIRAAALNNLALACAAAGDPARAIALAESALTLCIAQGDRHREAALHSNLADLLHEAGDSAAAMTHLKQAVVIYAEIGVEAGDVQPAVWRLAEW